ncbi:MAG: hypothetical protein WC383_07880 [Gammaproteobacteria bacterium]
MKYHNIRELATCAIGLTMCGGLGLGTTCLAAGGTELLSNRGFEIVAPVQQAHERWTFPGGTLPVSWEPEYTYGDAQAEVVQAAGTTNRMLRLKRGALRQRLNVEPSVEERVLTISFDVGGQDVTCLIRVNGRDCFSVTKPLTNELRRFQGQFLIKPGERISRFALWSYTNQGGEILIDNVSAVLEDTTAAAPVTDQKVAVPADSTSATVWLRTGGQGVTVTAEGRTGTVARLMFYPFSLPITDNSEHDGVTIVTRVLKDAGVAVSGLPQELRRYVRPNIMGYKPENMQPFMKEWPTLPSARNVRLPLTLRWKGEQVTCLLDSHYIGTFQSQGGLQRLSLSCAQGDGEISTPKFSTEPEQPYYESVPPRAFLTGSSDQNIAAEWFAVPGAPGKSVPCLRLMTNGVDLGITSRHRACYDHRYTSRSPFDAHRESIMVAVPAEQYTRAWVLCALDPAPEKDSSITARLTRFVSGGAFSGRGRESLADTTVRLPRADEPVPEGLTRVGEVMIGDQNVPLWLAEITLQSSAIQDLIFDDVGPKMQREPLRPGLDFELLGPLMIEAHPRTDTRHWPLESPVSGVRVYGVTLEKPAVEMEVRPTQAGNVFHNAEKPELHVALRTKQSGTYTLRWTIHNAEGKLVASKKRTLTLEAGEDERMIAVDLAQRQTGWYEIDLCFEQGNRQLLSHAASFALLGQDTRQATIGTSPFGTWWYTHHYCPKDPALGAGPLSLKAGLRRNAGASSNEVALAAWKTTAGSIGWPGALLAGNVPDEAIRQWIDKAVIAFPNCRNIMIFHENAGWPYRVAPELIGRKPLPEDEFPNADLLFKQAMRLAEIVRTHYPDLEIMLGNSLGCSELIAEMLRRGFPESYADFLGLEVVGRTGQPEKLWAGGQQSAWTMREIARLHGYHRWRVTSCVESNYRHDRLLGQQLQAEWYVRDALLLMAYRAPHISIAVLTDTGNSYNSGFWGGTGLCRRYPFQYPKKSYVAMAALTKTLDCAELTREVPTGSFSVYALEFKRPDNRWTYALWTGHGTADLKLRFSENSRYELTDLYGRTSAGSTFWGWRRLSLQAGTAVQYLTTSVPIKSITCGVRTYPDEPTSEEWRVVAPMDSLSDWQQVSGPDPLLEETTRTELPYRTAGNFEVRSVVDEQKGACLEVELLANTNLPALMNEYTVLRLKHPLELKENPETLGLWVKGNSGWGEVYWEIEDANGVRRLSCGTTVHGTSCFDYDARLATVNFDGWNLLCMPVTENSSIRDLSTGSVGNLWQAEKPGSVAYPIRLTGVAVSLPPHALYLTEMEPLRQVLRIKNVCVRDALCALNAGQPSDGAPNKKGKEGNRK